MEPNILLVKCITLLYRESQLENNNESSSDLVKTAAGKIREADVDIGMPTARSVTTALKALVLGMCQNPPEAEYELTELLQQARLVTSGDKNLYTAIEQGVKEPLENAALKKAIVSLRRSINTYYREQKNIDVLGKAFSDLRFNRAKISDMAGYVRSVITELEASLIKGTEKDPAIVKTLDFGDDDSVKTVFDDVLEANNGGSVYVTGWQELNTGLQGGLRPGNCVMTAADQHNYKTGSSLSLFAQIAMFNKPKCKDPNKKPLLYRITFEDPVLNNAQFLYQYLKFEETGEKVDVTKVSQEEMSSYVKSKLQRTGFHIIIDEINPMQWTYLHVINRVMELESMGYCVEGLFLDYMAKLPTTGCTQGSIGDDMMDMLARLKGYTSANGILFVTPHQLSTEAKRLLGHVPQEQFLNTIKGGGFFEKSKGLGRIYDIGILMHKCETQAGCYLHMLIDKHRFPTVIDSRLKSWFLRFPDNGMPIPSNLHVENHKVLRKIPRSYVSKDDDLF